MTPPIREVIHDDDGQVLAAACVDRPLTDRARAAFADLARAAQALHAQRDPDNLSADRQRIALDRIHKRQTPYCTAEGCGRVEGHDGRRLPREELNR